MTKTYSRAYTEVLEIISYFPEEEYIKIPKEKIEFYRNNKDEDYNYKIDPTLDLSQQQISDEANAILVTLFMDYFANERQKEILYELLYENQEKKESAKKEKYDPDKLFKDDENDNLQKEDKGQEIAIVEVKKLKWYQKIGKFLTNIIKKID